MPRNRRKTANTGTAVSHPAWTENPYFHAVLLAYQSGCDFARTLVSESGLDHKRAMKAKLGLDLLVDALAPTNFLPTNPAALERAFDTAGASLIKGARAFVADLLNNGASPGRSTPAGSSWAAIWR